MAEEENTRRRGTGHDRRRNAVAALITCLAIGAAIVHVADPSLKVDAVTAVFLVVAVVPWLGALFDSIELPGGMKLQYKQLVDRIDAAEERTVQAGHAADDASRAARLAFVATGGQDDEPASDFGASETVAGLAAAYDQAREFMPNGPGRTVVMERIFADLVTTTRRERDFDVEGSLTSDDPGTRLAGYARLYARPDAGHLHSLIDAVLADEERAFSQYWGFQAIGAILDTAGAGALLAREVAELQACLVRLPRDSDRIGVVSRLLARIRSSLDAS